MPGSRGTDPKCLFWNRPNLIIKLPRSCANIAAGVAKSTGDKLNVVLAKALCAELGVVYKPPVEKLPIEELKRRRRERDRPKMLARYYAGKVPKPTKEVRARSRAKKRMNHIAEFEAQGRPFVPKGETLTLYPVEWHKLPPTARRRLIRKFVHNEYTKERKLEAKAKVANDWFETHLNYKGQRKDGLDKRVSRHDKEALKHQEAADKWNRLQLEKSTRFRVKTAKVNPDPSVKWPSCGSCAFYALTRTCTCLFEKGGVPTQGDLVCEKYRTFDHSVEYPDDWYDFVNGVEKSRIDPRRGSKRGDEVLEKDETIDRLRDEKQRSRKQYVHTKAYAEKQKAAGKTVKLPSIKPSFISASFWKEMTKKPSEAELKIQGIRNAQLAQGIDTQKVDQEAIDRMNRIAATFKTAGYLPGLADEGHLFDDPEQEPRKEEPECPDAPPG